MPRIIKKDCEHCGKEYIPKRYWQKYCSRGCSQAAFWTRKIQNPSQYSDPLDGPPTEPTDAQKAEWERRGFEAKKREQEIIQREREEQLTKNKQIVEQANKILDTGLAGILWKEEEDKS